MGKIKVETPVAELDGDGAMCITRVVLEDGPSRHRGQAHEALQPGGTRGCPGPADGRAATEAVAA